MDSIPVRSLPQDHGVDENNLHAYGTARSTVKDQPLSHDEVELFNKYFYSSMYLCLGMIYLKHNPLLTEPLKKEHIKPRLLGHFGSDAGQSFTYIHMNRLIKKYDLNCLFISGPGHGAPAVISNSYLEGVYSEVYPVCGQNEEGLQKFFHRFSFPGGIGSHATPETPGSIHEGGELGYSISHAFGAIFDNPDLIALTMVGDGEAETGPLATSWHSNKFLGPNDGAVLPVLHLNGYKINNPTMLSRISHAELEALFKGYGWTPYFVEGDDLESMHQAMAATMEKCVVDIRELQKTTRDPKNPARPAWPMIVLRTPKGWTAPRKFEGHYLEGFWRAHQVPITDVLTNPKSLSTLEEWMRSYHPEQLFPNGVLDPELRKLAPEGTRRMSANPVTNGGNVCKNLKAPPFRDYAITFKAPGTELQPSMGNFAEYLRDIMKLNPDNFRLFGPDETQSNKLSAVYEVTGKAWNAEKFEEDADGGNLEYGGRVMEILSEHTIEGWLEGYLLTGRHGMLNSYESFIHIIDSMVGQHCKWLEKCIEVEWRTMVASLNILLTSTVWRQDHNGFTHQDPGFLDVLANKSPEVVRIYLPPDGNCLLSTMNHCLRSKGYVNVIVADKQKHLQYLDMESAITHCTKGLGIWDWASNDQNSEPDVVIASCGDVSTQEALAATALLRQHLPFLKIRFVNVVDLFKLQPNGYHPHGLTNAEYKAIFTDNRPVVFSFHSYPWLVHRFTYSRPGQNLMHVRGYKEKGNIDTPLELAIRNETDRFSLAILAIDEIKSLGNKGAAAREALRNEQIRGKNHAYEFGEDPQGWTDWTWPDTLEPPKIERPEGTSLGADTKDTLAIKN